MECGSASYRFGSRRRQSPAAAALLRLSKAATPVAALQIGGGFAAGSRRMRSIVLLLILTLPLRAADRQRIATLNVATTSLLTWVGCVAHAKITRTAPKHARCLAAGAIGGAGFFQAKRLAGDGHISTAWLVANLAGSVVENTTAGEHPLSRIGYSFGPLRLRVATPLDRARESLLDIDVSAVEVGYMARAFQHADDVDIRDGMVWYETEDPEIDEDGRVVHGFTWGLYPGVWSGAQKHVANHEAVHAVQSLQLDSVEPPALTLDRERRLVRVRHLRAGALNLADNVSAQLLPYDERWVEIEAYRLAQDRQPPP
jgi:hypothetical protein